MNTVKNNIIRLNAVLFNQARTNAVGERRGASSGCGGGVVIPPEEPDTPVTYVLSASVTNGTVTASVNGTAVALPYTANEGDVVVVEVTPNDGYEFTAWADGVTDNPRSITMTADVDLSATCTEVVVESKYIQFADPAVEAICVANWSSDGIGLTTEDIEAVTSISNTLFKGNTEITSFDELKYFTGVKNFSQNTFNGCTALQRIALPPKFTELYGTFGSCSALTTVANMGQVTKFGGNSFYACSNLQSVDLSSAIEIGSQAFLGCTALTTIEIPESCILIDSAAFRECSSLTHVICRATTPPTLGENAFYYTNDCPIYVPDVSVEAYKTATNWSQYSDRIKPLSEIEGGAVFYDKLVGDGVAYINTQYFAKGTDSFAWDVTPPSTFNKFVFGTKSISLCLGSLTYTKESSYYLTGANNAEQVYQDNSNRKMRSMVVTKVGDTYQRDILTDGEVLHTFGQDSTYSQARSDTPILLFACQYSTGLTSPDRIYNGSIYAFSITDIDGNIIMSLRPCTYGGEAGMWDEIGGKFYGSASSSGSFTAANDE